MSQQTAVRAAASIAVARRVTWALFAAFLGAFAGFEVANHGPAALAAVIVSFLAPDLTFAIGAKDAKAPHRRQLQSRAVRAYNLMHTPWLPLSVLVLYTVAPIEWVPMFAAGLGWLAHISLDRAFGHGLRIKEGFQRG